MKTQQLFLVTLIISLLVLGCERVAVDEENTEKTGKLLVTLTDAPFPSDLVDEVNVTIERVELKLKSDDDYDDEDEKSTMSGDEIDSLLVISAESQIFNLLDLSNGIKTLLAEVEIPSGEYSEIRLIISAANIVLTDGKEFDLEVPSGKSSGIKIKIKPTLVVYSGMENEVILDFDVSRSFKVKGNPKNKHGIKGFMFKPVIRAVNNSLAGKIQGTVKNIEDELIQDAYITLFNETDTVTTAISNKDGYYAIIGLPQGNYQINCGHDDYLISETFDVEVIEEEVTQRNFVLTK